MMFEHWLLATGFPSTAPFASRKVALLRSSLGAEGSRIYYSLANEVKVNEQYTTVVERMARHFGSPSTLFSTAPSSPGTYSVPATLWLSSYRRCAN